MSDDTKNVYTEDQHFALLTAAVERETSSLTQRSQELETQVTSLTETTTELQGRIDVLEGEKAAESARAESAEKAFEDFKTELAEKAAVEARKAERIAAAREANEFLTDEYFGDEARVQRWAEMADETFEAVLDGLREGAASAKAKGAKKDAAPAKKDDNDEDDADKVAQKARETAAFTGGTSPTAGQGSVLSQFLTATGALPASKN